VLDLYETQVSDVSALASLKALEWLHLKGTQVRDAAPLARISTLNSVYAGSKPEAEAFARQLGKGFGYKAEKLPNGTITHSAERRKVTSGKATPPKTPAGKAVPPAKPAPVGPLEMDKI
jgi:hypothetical protein